MKTARTILYVVTATALLVATTGLVACGPKEEETIKIGVLAPLTGEVATYGVWFKNSAELARDEINDEGGVLGKELEFIIEDTAGDPKAGVNAAKKLIEVDKVGILLGPAASGVVLSVAPLAEQNQVVLLSPIASNYMISESGDYIFRIAPSDTLQSKILSAWIYNDLEYDNAAVVYTNNDYGVGLKEAFESDYAGYGGTIALAESCDPNATDLRTQITKIKELKDVDFVMLFVYPEEGGYFLKQSKEMGLTLPVIGTDTLHDAQVLEIAGDAANGLTFTDVAEVSGAEWEAFSKKYKERFGEDPNIVCAESYDGVKVLVEAIEKAGSADSDAVKEALYGIQGYLGASGDITFDENGDVVNKTFYKYTVEDGDYKLLEE